MENTGSINWVVSAVNGESIKMGVCIRWQTEINLFYSNGNESNTNTWSAQSSLLILFWQIFVRRLISLKNSSIRLHRQEQNYRIFYLIFFHTASGYSIFEFRNEQSKLETPSESMYQINWWAFIHHWQIDCLWIERRKKNMCINL